MPSADAIAEQYWAKKRQEDTSSQQSNQQQRPPPTRPPDYVLIEEEWRKKTADQPQSPGQSSSTQDVSTPRPPDYVVGPPQQSESPKSEPRQGDEIKEVRKWKSRSKVESIEVKSGESSQYEPAQSEPLQSQQEPSSSEDGKSGDDKSEPPKSGQEDPYKDYDTCIKHYSEAHCKDYLRRMGKEVPREEEGRGEERQEEKKGGEKEGKENREREGEGEGSTESGDKEKKGGKKEEKENREKEGAGEGQEDKERGGRGKGNQTERDSKAGKGEGAEGSGGEGGGDSSPPSYRLVRDVFGNIYVEINDKRIPLSGSGDVRYADLGGGWRVYVYLGDNYYIDLAVNTSKVKESDLSGFISEFSTGDVKAFDVGGRTFWVTNSYAYLQGGGIAKLNKEGEDGAWADLGGTTVLIKGDKLTTVDLSKFKDDERGVFISSFFKGGFEYANQMLDKYLRNKALDEAVNQIVKDIGGEVVERKSDDKGGEIVFVRGGLAWRVRRDGDKLSQPELLGYAERGQEGGYEIKPRGGAAKALAEVYGARVEVTQDSVKLSGPERVEYKNGKLYVNGIELPDDYQKARELLQAIKAAEERGGGVWTFQRGGSTVVAPAGYVPLDSVEVKGNVNAVEISGQKFVHV
ncbi:MAG: hypothetical protein ACK4SY_09965, partial [Pyrobaculum sp.]